VGDTLRTTAVNSANTYGIEGMGNSPWGGYGIFPKLQPFEPLPHGTKVQLAAAGGYS
jgi:hypothetical protein